MVHVSNRSSLYFLDIHLFLKKKDTSNVYYISIHTDVWDSRCVLRACVSPRVSCSPCQQLCVSHVKWRFNQMVSYVDFRFQLQWIEKGDCNDDLNREIFLIFFCGAWDLDKGCRITCGWDLRLTYYLSLGFFTSGGASLSSSSQFLMRVSTPHKADPQKACTFNGHCNLLYDAVSVECACFMRESNSHPHKRDFQPTGHCTNGR